MQKLAPEQAPEPMPVNRRSTMTQYERQDDGLDSALQPTTNSQLIDTRLLIEDHRYYRRNSLKSHRGYRAAPIGPQTNEKEAVANAPSTRATARSAA
jgi:hypothetical protein